MKFLEFLRGAYSDANNPSSSRLHTAFAVYGFVSGLLLGFWRVCGDPALKDLIIPYAWILAGLTAGVLGIQVTKNILSEEKPAEPKPNVPQP
jgi:hypothetical protein